MCIVIMLLPLCLRVSLRKLSTTENSMQKNIHVYIGHLRNKILSLIVHVCIKEAIIAE